MCACDQCNNWYSWESDLSGDRKFVHEGMDFHCGQCDYRVIHWDKWKLHKVIKHEEEVDKFDWMNEKEEEEGYEEE